ncbi:MAG TPA: hypothetical protein VHB18_11820 [Mycobacteriales bacterium]|jgi:hypothetical protein|nr:hypothetical protein [Mycobacteriales bacterium]
MTAPLILAWYESYGRLEVEECSTLESALDLLDSLENREEGISVRIETITPGGTTEVIDSTALSRMMTQRAGDLYEAQRKRERENPPPIEVAVLHIGYGDDAAEIKRFTDRGHAQAEIDRLKPFLGDRLAVEWHS